MNKLPFQDANSPQNDFQYLEDLATAYWYSEVLFTAIDIGLFSRIGQSGKDLHALSSDIGCDPGILERVLTALQRLAIVDQTGPVWFNTAIAERFLTKDSPDYMGDFFLYRRYMQPGWQMLAEKLRPNQSQLPQPHAGDDYETRNLAYVRAMDTLARQKAKEIASRLNNRAWRLPILDIGGGAGALCRALISGQAGAEAFLIDLPEVISAAKTLYPAPEAWQNIHCIEGDFRSFKFSPDRSFGLILMGNFLHVYGEAEAKCLLHKACGLAAPDGLLLIHDYFPDREGRSPQKGVMYDLAMMLNTYNGKCHSSRRVIEWLAESGLTDIEVTDLSTDSSLIGARIKRTDKATSRPD